MTQITIAQWLSNNSTTQEKSMPRYIIANSKKFFGHYDILDTHTGSVHHKVQRLSVGYSMK